MGKLKVWYVVTIGCTNLLRRKYVFFLAPKIVEKICRVNEEFK